MSVSNLPVVLISVTDKAAADSIISDLLEGEVVEWRNEVAEWELRNKYYHCKVLVVTRIGNEDPSGPIEAHLVYLKSGEEEETAQLLTQNIEAEIKLVVTRTVPSDAIRLWSTNAGYELVSLDPNSVEEDDEDSAADAHGVPRLHAALQAHPWRNLHRNTDAIDVGDGDDGSEEDVEQFSGLLGILQHLRHAPRAAARAETAAERAARHERAARALAGVLRALGEDELLDDEEAAGAGAGAGAPAAGGHAALLDPRPARSQHHAAPP